MVQLLFSVSRHISVYITPTVKKGDTIYSCSYLYKILSGLLFFTVTLSDCSKSASYSRYASLWNINVRKL